MLGLALAATCAAATASAHAAWYEAKSKHFVIYANEESNQLREYAEKLERFDKAVRYIRRMEDPDLTPAGRVTVYVMADQNAIESLLGAEGIRGVYMPRVSGSIAFVPRVISGRWEMLKPQEVFFHEYAHHLQLQDAKVAIPTWAVEGFAEFFASAEVRKDGSVLIGAFPEYRWHGVGDTKTLPLEKILGETYGDRLTLEQMDTLYGRGWLLTHYLSMTDARKGQFSHYIAGIQKGLTPLESAKAAFGDLAQLERDIDHYEKHSITGFRLDSKVISIGQVEVRPLGPGEAAMMNVVMHSKRGVDSTTAAGVAAEARSVAAKFPDDAAVQSALAEADYDAEDYLGAKAAAARAISLDPKNVHALIYEGRAQMALAKTNPKAADWDSIRGWFTKANAIDTENAEALELYYDTYVEAGERPTQNAADALLYATDLAPRDDGLRMAAVGMLISQNKLADARGLLAPVAYEPHLPTEMRELAGKIMAALAQQDSKTALALMSRGTASTGSADKNKKAN